MSEIYACAKNSIMLDAFGCDYSAIFECRTF